ncbi:sugar phosphate isomerase/epimerase [Streptomyces sp. NPDC088124]|uniref:sugar phosphate isomerase/epimerase family protein n=1 Tax=Streptomyces sp. NPDC088124 TaxID=3154654 RepID=UPI00342DC63C
MGREFEASHLPVADFDAGAAERTRELFARHHLEISALAFHENNLHPDPVRRGEVHTHLKAVVDAAAALEVPYVGTFVGRDWNLPVAANLTEAEKVFPDLVDYAGERGVKIIIENCVMEGWHPDGYPGNLAYSPELWEWMFSLGLYLNRAPSHLTWIGIDPVTTIAPYAGPHSACTGQGHRNAARSDRPLWLLRQGHWPRHSVGHRLVALPRAWSRTGRLERRGGRPVRARLQRNPVGRARRPVVERH